MTATTKHRFGKLSSCPPRSTLKQATILKIVLDDNVCDGVEHELNIVCVGGTRQMRVDLFLVFPLVEVLELHANVAGRLIVRAGTAVLREADGQRRPLYFLLEQVFFV